jgi:hypothetical protein
MRVPSSFRYCTIHIRLKDLEDQETCVSPSTFHIHPKELEYLIDFLYSLSYCLKMPILPLPLVIIQKLDQMITLLLSYCYIHIHQITRKIS